MTPFIGRPGRLAWITSLVVALAVVDWILRPDRAWSWLLALSLMAAIRLVASLFTRARRSAARRRALSDAAAFGGLVLAAGLAVALLRALGLEDSWAAERALGIVTSAVLLVMGNAIPKLSIAHATRACVHGSYAMRRFAGWMFAGAGAFGLSGWLFAPVAQAQVIATVTCFGAVALVLVRCIASPSTKSVRPD